MKIEHKSQVVHELKLDDAGTVEIAFAQLNVIDHDGDVTLPGAFPQKDVPLSAYGHGSWDGALPVGRGSISEEGDWAVFKGSFFMDTTHGHDAHATLKGLGELAEFSYGYNVIDGGPGTFNGTKVRELRSLDVMEVSNVLKGAGLGTHLRAIKSDAPGTGAPYAEYASWYLEHVPALIERTQDRLEFRQSEGRDLSAKDRERLEDIAFSFVARADAIRDILATDDEDTNLAVEIERARGLGVKL